MKKTKCYIYTRVSTAMQVDGYSLDAQKDKLKRYAAYEEIQIAGEYSDEGHSGKILQGDLTSKECLRILKMARTRLASFLFSNYRDLEEMQRMY